MENLQTTLTIDGFLEFNLLKFTLSNFEKKRDKNCSIFGGWCWAKNLCPPFCRSLGWFFFFFFFFCKEKLEWVASMWWSIEKWCRKLCWRNRGSWHFEKKKVIVGEEKEPDYLKIWNTMSVFFFSFWFFLWRIADELPSDRGTGGEEEWAEILFCNAICFVVLTQ